MKKIFYKIWNTFWNKCFFIYVIIGIVNTIIYNEYYLSFLYFSHYIIASLASYVIAMTCSFFLNCNYNFKVKPTIKRYIMFPLSGIPSLLMQTVGLSLFVELLSIDEKIAGFVASLVAIPFSFLIMKMVFKKNL